MWILPKPLHTLACVVDTQALILDLNEQSQACSQSLTARSKLLPVQTWLRKWKKDSWTQHLSGRILKHSHGKAFLEKWISFLEDTHVNHSAQQEEEKDQKTQDICGHTSQMEFDFPNQESASLKMSKDIFRWDSPQSSAIWKKWVIKCRGEYSQRLKLAHLIKENEHSYWPTIRCQEPGKTTVGYGRGLAELVEGREQLGLAGKENCNTNGSRQESWATPIVGDSHLNSTPEVAQKRMEEGKATLSRQVALFMSPKASDSKSPGKSRDVHLNHQAGGKLNPRWVETLMGVPIGWVMPSCTSPVTIDAMNCDC